MRGFSVDPGCRISMKLIYPGLGLRFNLTQMKKNTDLIRDYKIKIGGNIRKWRNLKGIKQKQLAHALELSEAAISNIENNLTDVTLSQLEDISVGLDVPVEQLFSDPQETYSHISKPAAHAATAPAPEIEKELMNAIILSMQKKDEQLQAMMQNMLHTMSALMPTMMVRRPQGKS